MSDSWEDLKEKGNALFKQKRYEDAISYYNKAIKLNPNQEVLYSNKGTCEKCLKEYKEAIRDYEKALEINPKNTKNMNRLASVYIIKGKIGDAKIMQEKALNLEPYNSTFREQMTSIEKILEDEVKLEDKIKDKKFEDAEEVCKRLIEKVSDFSELKLKYIQVLIENVKLTDALQYINKEINFEDKKNNEQFDYLTALCLYYDGQYEKAKKQINLMKSKGNSIDTKDLLNKVSTIESVKNKANEIFKQKKYEEAIEEVVVEAEEEENAETPTESGQQPGINYVVANNGVPYYPREDNRLPSSYRGWKDFSYGVDTEGNRTIVNEPGEITPENSTISSVRDVTRQMRARTASRARPAEQQQQQPTAQPTNTAQAPAPQRKYTSAEIEGVDNSDIAPVNQGWYDYIRNQGYGSTSSILGQMGYSQDKIRRMLDSSGAIRPEFLMR